MAKGNKVFIIGCLGCGGILGLLFLLFAGGIGFIAYQGYQFGQEIGETYQDVVVDYQNLDEQIDFFPPENGILDKERVNTYLKIRTDVTKFAKDYLDKIEAKGNEIDSQFNSSGILSKLHGFGKIKEIVLLAVNMIAEIGDEHIQQLKESDMSWKEYQWITRIYLGTLSKAEANGYEQGAEMWETYLKNFDKARDHTRDMKMEFDKTRIRGDRMNRRNMEEELEKVDYKVENKEIVESTAEQFLSNNDAPVLDFLALKLDEIIKELSGKNKPS